MTNYLASNLKFLRGIKKISQKKIADMLEMKRGTYSKYEDNINEPSVLTLLKIKNYYQLNSIDELVFTNLKKQKK